MIGAPGRESTVQLGKEKKGTRGREPGDRARLVPYPTKKQLEMLTVESFTASTAEPGKVQLCGGGASVEGKQRNRSNITTNKPMSAQRPSLKVSNYKDDRWINPQGWEETSAKRLKTSKIRMSLLLQGIAAPHQQGNKA